MSETPNPEQQPNENPPQPPVYEPSQPPEFKDLTPDATNMAMLAHLLGAFFGIIGSVIIWLVKKDDHPFIDDQGKEATNFQLTILIAYLVMSAVAVGSCGFLFFAPALPYILQVVFGIIGALKAKDGIAYRYPIIIRLIK